MKNIETAYIFDMDGVIVDSERLWGLYESNFIRSIVPNFPDSAQKELLGRSNEGIYEFLRDNYGLEISLEAFLKAYQQFGVEQIYKNVSLSPGFLEVLDKVSAKSKTALASSSPYIWINTVLDLFELREKFDVVLSGDDVDGKGKPAPDIFLEVAKRLGVDPSNCTVVEDAKNGVLAGKLAGMKVLGYRNGYNNNQDLSEADQEFNNFSKLSLS